MAVTDRIAASGTASPPPPTFDPALVPATAWSDRWRAFRTAVLVGWRTEANWTDPLLFFIYSVAKPVAAALILAFMVTVIAGTSDPQLRAFVVAGSAFWAFVVSGIQGLALSIIEDRERYRMLKYVYLSPSDFGLVMLGRGVARVAIGGMGALITLSVGIVFLGVPFEPLRVNWPLFAAVMAVGLVAIVGLAVLMAAICMQTRQDSWSYPEAVAGALFLLVGAVFPLTVLPAPLQVLGLVTPLAWWMGGVRAALFPDAPSTLGGPGSVLESIAGPGAPSNELLVGALVLTTAVWGAVSLLAFVRSERRAKDLGLLDRTSAY
jgi:ABC-2 type transport system permease protein